MATRHAAAIPAQQCLLLRRFSAQELIVGLLGLVSGLHHMHSQGICDQDIHTGNVLLSLKMESTWVKTDLGAAVWTHQDGLPVRLTHSM